MCEAFDSICFLHNILGPTAFAANHCTDILSTFLSFMNPIENEILRMTNLFGVQMYKDNWDNVDCSELRAYFGLLLLAGVFRSYGEETSELWDDGTGRAIFRATMSRDRFQKITRCLRFDNRADRNERRARDKLAPIRTVYDKWNRNLRRLYNPGEHITVDEQLVPFRGRCPFKQYIPSKPARYGIKIWAACDSDNAYIWNTDVYTGRAPNTRPEVNQGKRVVLQLTENLQGRLVVTDNFFTSHELAVELLRRGMTLLGTVRKNKTFVPLKLLDMKKKPPTYSEFLFDNQNKISMVSYVPKKNRFVLLLSSAHMSRNVSADSHQKPIMIMDYNKYKGGVDQADHMIGTYTCKRKINRWPAALFGYILDASSLNAFIIHSIINPQWNQNKAFKRRLFLKELGNALVRPHMVNRKQLPHGRFAAAFLTQIREPTASKSREQFTTPSSTSTERFTTPRPSTSTERSALTSPSPKVAKKSRARCAFCPYNKSGNKYSKYCNKCGRAMCPSHSVPDRCFECANTADN